MFGCDAKVGAILPGVFLLSGIHGVSLSLGTIGNCTEVTSERQISSYPGCVTKCSSTKGKQPDQIMEILEKIFLLIDIQIIFLCFAFPFL